MASRNDTKEGLPYKTQLENMAKRYTLFNKSYKFLQRMWPYLQKGDLETNNEIGKLADKETLGMLLERMESIVLSEYSKNTEAAEKTGKLFSNILTDITALVEVSADIGNIYDVKGQKKSLLDLNILLAERIIDDPYYCGKALKLLNKVAINCFAINEIMKQKSFELEESPLLKTLLVKLYESLVYTYDSMPLNKYRSFVKKSFSMINGSEKGYNIALLKRGELSKGIADDKIAVNRLVGLYYIVDGLLRE